MESKSQQLIIRRVRYVTFYGMITNIFLSLLKGFGGIVFKSHALTADAIHSLSDLLTDIILIFGVKFWTAPPDELHPYGHGRIETLVSMFIGVLLGLVAFGLISDAVTVIEKGAECRPAMPAFVIAVLSIVMKEVLYHWTMRHSRALNSPALKANAWHHRSDAISSIPVAAAIVLSHYFPNLKFIDPLGSILVSLFILHAAWEILYPCLNEFSEAGSKDITAEISRFASAFPGVKGVHAIRTRRLGSMYYADLHVMVDPDLTVLKSHAIAHRLKMDILQAQIGVKDIIIHIEPFGAAKDPKGKK